MFVAASHPAGMGFQATTTGYSVGSSISESESTGSWVAIYTKQHHEKRVAEYLADQAFDCICHSYLSGNGASPDRDYRFATVSNISFCTNFTSDEDPNSANSGCDWDREPRSIDETISDHEIEILRVVSLRHPNQIFVGGGSVRIAAGPLAGIQGIIVKCKSSLRMVITVPMIQQSVSVEVAADELAPCVLSLHADHASA